MYYIINGELYHHGIKGMKWGVRRYQNPDGSLTALGRKHYGREIIGAYNKIDAAKRNLKLEKRNYNRKTLGGTFYNEKAAKDLAYAQKEVKWAKNDLSSAKIKQKLSESKKAKSKHRLKLEQHYRDKGMSADEAAVAAYKRERTEKILAVTLGVTVAAASAYAAYKYHNYSVDKIIKSGTMISRISSSSNAGVHDAFYAATDKADITKYIGGLGKEYAKAGMPAYQKLMRNGSDIKLASEKNALQGLRELSKSKGGYVGDLKKTLNDAGKVFPQGMTSEQSKTLSKALASLDKGRVDGNVYRALNMNFVQRDSPAVKDFYKHMASKGYGAVMDINDQKLGGYMAKTPVVIFNNKDIKVEAVRKLGEAQVNKAFIDTAGELSRKATIDGIMSIAAPAAAGATAVSVGSAAVNSGRNDNIVKKYRKEHPDTKLSYTEIIRNYEKNRSGKA